MVSQIVVAGALILAGHSDSALKLCVLVTHEQPKPELAEVLSGSATEFALRAESAGLVVFESEIAVVARSKDLYNLDYMDRCIGAFDVLRGMAASGQFYRGFSEMTPVDRARIRSIFADSSLMSSFGPNLMADDSSFRLERKATLTITDGRRNVTIRLPFPGEAQPKDFVRDVPTDKALTDFREKVLPTVQKKRFPDALVFTFAKSELISGTRPLVIAEYCKNLTEVLEGQRKRYMSARSALDAALMNGKLPQVGASLVTLDDATQRYIESLKRDQFAAFGFDSREAADAFFDHARVGGVKVEPYLGIGVRMANGQVVEAFTAIDVNRNTPPP